MSNTFKVLIADRNRHVREFLRRELIAEGYHVQIAKDGREVMAMVDMDDPPDLLILDLELPNSGGVAILEQLQGRKTCMPVVIHAFLTEYESHPAVLSTAAFVEKRGDTDRLKRTVMDVLRRHYPHRCEMDGAKAVEKADGKPTAE